MIDRLRALCDDSGPLRGVRGRLAERQSARFEVVELVFDNGVLGLDCDIDTDEVVVDVVENPSAALTDLADCEPFTCLIGKTLEYAWSMTNHRGYSDAFQLRFRDLATRKESCIQFEVAASAMAMRCVS